MTSFITSHPTITVTDWTRAVTLCSNGVTRAGLSGIISIADPPPYDTKRPRDLDRVGVPILALDFRDIEYQFYSGEPAADCPTKDHVSKIISFGRSVQHRPGRLLIHCTAGRSRSTAAAFVILCDRLSTGTEVDALSALLTACERTPLPNTMMVSLADDVLGRGGRMHIVASAQNNEPRDAEADALKPVTGTAILAGIRNGTIK